LRKAEDLDSASAEAHTARAVALFVIRYPALDSLRSDPRFV
jgi:hypothetical protein